MFLFNLMNELRFIQSDGHNNFLKAVEWHGIYRKICVVFCVECKDILVIFKIKMKKYNYEVGVLSSFSLKRYLSSISNYHLIIPSIFFYKWTRESTYP